MRAVDVSQGLVEEARIPRSAIGKLGARLVELINTGDSNEELAFLQSSISQRGLRRNSLDSYMSTLKRVREQSKGVTVIHSHVSVCHGRPLDSLNPRFRESSTRKINMDAGVPGH